MISLFEQYMSNNEDRVSSVLSNDENYISAVAALHLVLHWCETRNLAKIELITESWVMSELGICSSDVASLVVDLCAYILARSNKASRLAYSKSERIERAQEFWNISKREIDMAIAQGGDDSFFKWDQLVRQELFMWASIGDPVDDAEFEWVSNRRGFDDHMRSFLRRGLQYIGLSK